MAKKVKIIINAEVKGIMECNASGNNYCNEQPKGGKN